MRKAVNSFERKQFIWQNVYLTKIINTECCDFTIAWSQIDRDDPEFKYEFPGL
jgi:hypothetical protein